MKTIVKYPGSKWRIADWIISFFPQHHSYLEPFFGSGAVLFRKPRSNIETINDLDGDVVNLFRWVKEDPERLAKEIYYTPYARQAYEEAFRSTERSSLRRAVHFLIRANMGYAYRTNGEQDGWKNDVQGRERAYSARDWCTLPEEIMQAAERLRGVQIERRPAVEVIRCFNHPGVLIYADPPYLPETRSGEQYAKEMDAAAHEELLVALAAHKGPVLLSGYDNALYNSLLRGWHKEETASRTRSGAKRTETLWMNFEPRGRQMELREFLEN